MASSSRSKYAVKTAEEEEADVVCARWIFLYVAVLHLGLFAITAVISYTHVFPRAKKFDKIFFGVMGAVSLSVAVGIICVLLRGDFPFRNNRATARVADLPPVDVC